MSAQHHTRHHRRLLVEDHTGELADADFSLFRAAGFDVDFCPRHGEEGCDLLDTGECRTAEGADVVLFNLDASTEREHRVLRALRSRYPQTPVVVRVPKPGHHEGVPQGCRTIAVPMSVDGQARALWAAMTSRRRAV